MELEQIRRFLESLSTDATQAETAEEVRSISWRARRVLKSTSNRGLEKDTLIRSLEDVENVLSRSAGSLLFPDSRRRSRLAAAKGSLKSTLDNAMFEIDLHAVGKDDTARVSLSPTEIPVGSLDLLRNKLAALLVDADELELSADERANLRAVLNEALRIVDRASTGQIDLRDVHELIGNAVAQSTRQRSSPIWHTVVDAILITEAVLSIGTNVHVLERAGDAVVEVVRYLDGPPTSLELGPGDADPVNQDAANG